MKVRSVQGELENAQKESRSYSAELFRNKSKINEYTNIVESLRKENSIISSKH